jgi:hypothetical protein
MIRKQIFKIFLNYIVLPTCTFLSIFSSSINSRLSLTIISLLILSCSSKESQQKEEQIRIQNTLMETNGTDSVQLNSIQGNLTLNQISTEPNSIVLTGLPLHRLITVYKLRVKVKASDSYSGYREHYESAESEREEHFMPGLDLIYGYNLLNLAHYDLTTEKLQYLFDHPVLIKSLYYPSFIQDSLYKKPITRDYYLISVYDSDTSMDTLINKKDLRRFYYFNATANERIQLVPADYSVVRSQYDPRNDVMYIFARHDENKNGIIDKKEPLHIFWFSLNIPAKAKRLY